MCKAGGQKLEQYRPTGLWQTKAPAPLLRTLRAMLWSMQGLSSSRPALAVIDVQRAIDHPNWARYGPRNHPGAERNIAQLLDAWRRRHLPVYHVRHDSLEPGSHYRPGQDGNQFKPEVQPFPGEPVIVKHTNSAFIGTGFEETLRQSGHNVLVVAGVITNNSVEATVRMAGNLGFETYLVEDACFTYPRPDWTGRVRSAEEVHAMSLANLHQEYCTVLTTGAMLGSLAPLLPGGLGPPEVRVD